MRFFASVFNDLRGNASLTTVTAETCRVARNKWVDYRNICEQIADLQEEGRHVDYDLTLRRDHLFQSYAETCSIAKHLRRLSGASSDDPTFCITPRPALAD